MYEVCTLIFEYNFHSPRSPLLITNMIFHNRLKRPEIQIQDLQLRASPDTLPHAVCRLPRKDGLMPSPQRAPLGKSTTPIVLKIM